MKKYPIITIFLISIFGCSKPNDTIRLRLQWFPHAQFAGYLIAEEKGFYQEMGLNIEIAPAGPDIKPTTTVANGTDHFGIGVPNQVMVARSNGVPLTIIAQIFQDSPNRYILKKENKIDSLSELRGEKVGLWLGGDEAEFISMLGSVGMSLQDVEVIPQGFTVEPFLEDQYRLSQVTNYGELNVLKSQGYSEEDFQILSPKDFGAAILGDMIFCRQDFLVSSPEVVEKFLEASFKGWQYVLTYPEESLEIILTKNPELERSEQELVLQTIIQLVSQGENLTQGLGAIEHTSYENIMRILFESNQVESVYDVADTYDQDIWKRVNNAVKEIKN